MNDNNELRPATLEDIPHKFYFWFGVAIWIITWLVGPNEQYPWWAPIFLFPFCWASGYIIVWTGYNDLLWAQKVNWQGKWMDKTPFQVIIHNDHNDHNDHAQ